jgi:hypothetical protein
MTDVGKWLRAADPLAHEPELSHVEVSAMRREVIAAADRQRAAATPWPSALLVATTIAATLVAGVTIGRWFPPRAQETVVSGGMVPEAGGRRQLQFATRGGTRVIWVFDPEFQP